MWSGTRGDKKHPTIFDFRGLNAGKPCRVQGYMRIEYHKPPVELTLRDLERALSVTLKGPASRDDAL